MGTVFKIRQDYGDKTTLPIFRPKIELIRLNQYTTAQYFKNLARVFGANHYISLKFEYEDGQKSISKVYGAPNRYFVQVKQYWDSSKYHDVGYLTMLWDFSDDENPKVETRIWLPNKIQQFSKADNITIFKD